MELDLESLSPQERLPLELRLAYEAEGFRQYRMSRFEEYAFYQENRRFLSGGPALTFTDLDGRLMALKPDVTLSVAKNAGPGSYYYLENVYRPGRDNRGFEEIRQMGLERIGDLDAADVAQVVGLARRSLSAAGERPALEIGHMGYLTGLLDALGVARHLRGELLRRVRDKNAHDLSGVADARDLEALRDLDGDWETVLPMAEALAKNDAMRGALQELRELYAFLSARDGEAADLRLNLSLANDLDYYNGLILQGFLAGVPRPVLRGGQYDPLVSRFHTDAKAIGFALYLDELERVSGTARPGLISVALPKGRLGDKVYRLLESVGYGSPEDYEGTRKLVVENPAAGIRYFLVKPSDVAVYVERGAADVGIVGKDILEEKSPDVYELLDTGLGKCRMCVAGTPDGLDVRGRRLRVATKFVRIAKRHFASLGQDIDIIKLHGSIELAPLLGLTDVIVDIVETGTTLRENNLHVLEEFLPISARLIANRSAYQFKRADIDALTEKLREVTRT